MFPISCPEVTVRTSSPPPAPAKVFRGRSFPIACIQVTVTPNYYSCCILKLCSLGHSTLRHFAPIFWFPSTKSHRPGQSNSESFPGGCLLVFLSTCPDFLPYHLVWSRKGAAPRRLPASAAANQRLPHTHPRLGQSRCSDAAPPPHPGTYPG